MTVSDQIIAVMNDLCQKFGIAIDWSQENVIPYLTELAGKYISYEIATSIAWAAISGVILLVSAIICKIAYIIPKYCAFKFKSLKILLLKLLKLYNKPEKIA